MTFLRKIFQNNINNLSSNLLLYILVLISLLPLLLGAINTFKSDADIIINPLTLPNELDFSNFSRAWKAGKFKIGIINSILLSGTTIIVTLSFASLGAFVLARRSIVGWQIITIYFLCATTIPIQLFLFPLYFVFAKLGIIGNVIATAFILSAINLPLATFLLRTYVLTIPSEIDDAAFLDGASPIQTFLHIIFPLLRPGLVTVGIIVGLNAWNEFLITSTFQQGQSSFTMTLGYLSMNGTYATDQGAMMAGAFILVAPIIVFFIVMQRLFISGMAAGAVKG